jgi:ElaB/YqjD/DUF883 family membrane-anchored ribosome-binding protein
MTDTSPNGQQPPDQDSAERAATPLREARRTLIKSVYSTKDAAADQLITSAERIRAEAFRSGDDVVIRQAQQLTSAMERSAVYLHSHTFDQMTGDATLMVRHRPWQAVMIAFLVGVIFGRSFQRYQQDR